MIYHIILLITLTNVVIHASIQNPKIQPTPPMGWNNWARYECGLNESMVLDNAQQIESTGLLAAGYKRLNLDDCWMKTSREPDGTLLWNSTLFPRGLPWLSRNLKSKGFHFGIYQNAGNPTCGGYPGSFGFENIDAKTFASWGIDYVKLDGCNVPPKTGASLDTYKNVYETWHKELAPLGIVFSESAPAYFSGDSFFPKQTTKSNWYKAMKWAPNFGELARHSNDIFMYGYPDFAPSDYWKSIMSNYRYQLQLARYQKPGFYNDPDFLITEWPWLTIQEKMSQFALWCAFSAPLIISSKISNLTPLEIAILKNSDLININQDPLSHQATIVTIAKTFDVLTKTLANHDRLLVVLNKKNTELFVDIDFKKVGFSVDSIFDIKNLWNGDRFSRQNVIRLKIPPHGTSVHRFINQNDTEITPTGSIFQNGADSIFRCVNSHNGNLHVEPCTGVNADIWRISSDGHISTHDRPDLCLVAKGSRVELNRCDKNNFGQRWIYEVSGNIINFDSRACLTTSWISKLEVMQCGDELDSQVFSVPNGIEVVYPQQAQLIVQD